MHTFKPRGVCSNHMHYDIEDGKIKNLTISNGCDGNNQAISKLVEGRDVVEVIDLLKGIDCRKRGTSCADQLAQALSQTI